MGEKIAKKNDIHVFLVYAVSDSSPEHMIRSINKKVRIYNENEYTVGAIYENAKSNCTTVIMVDAKNVFRIGGNLLRLGIDSTVVHCKQYKRIKLETEAMAFNKKIEKLTLFNQIKSWVIK